MCIPTAYLDKKYRIRFRCITYTDIILMSLQVQSMKSLNASSALLWCKVCTQEKASYKNGVKHTSNWCALVSPTSSSKEEHFLDEDRYAHNILAVSSDRCNSISVGLNPEISSTRMCLKLSVLEGVSVCSIPHVGQSTRPSAWSSYFGRCPRNFMKQGSSPYLLTFHFRL